MNLYRPVKTDAARWFSPDEVEKARRYQRPLKKVRLASTILNLVLLVVLISMGAAPRLLDAIGVDGWALQTVAVVAGLIVAFTIADLPLGIWTEFVHERRWGFSTQTPARYAADEVRNVLLMTVLLSALAVVVWGLIQSTTAWWLWGWLAFYAFTVVLLFLGPVVLMPLFNKFEPTSDDELRARVRELGTKAGVSISDVLVMDASKRTRKDNAFFTGLGGTKRVVVFDNMLSRPPEELQVVVAHEIGHWRRKHIFRFVSVSAVLTFLVFLALRLISTWEPALRWAGVDSIEDPASLPLVAGVFAVASAITMPLQAWLSRAFERQADLDALELTDDVPGFMAAMRQLATKNLAELAPSWWDRMKASHPPIAERLAFGEEWERTSRASA